MPFLCAFETEVTLRKENVDIVKVAVDVVREAPVETEIEDKVYIFDSKYRGDREILGDFSTQDNDCLVGLFNVHGIDRMSG